MMAEHTDVYTVDAFTRIAMLEGENLRLKQQIKAYQDKIEQGTLIELPCKVGDTVYKVEREYGYSNDTYFWNIVEKQFELGMLDYLWGKMIFLTREEAEKRLKELQE